MVRLQPASRHCRGCWRLLPLSQLPRGPRRARRCDGCRRAAARAGTDLPLHRACGDCGDEARCLPDDSGALVWRCAACLRVAALARGVVTSRSTVKQTEAQRRAEIAALIARHRLRRVYVDVWVIALTPICGYYLLRIVLWRRCGCLAGLLPAAGAVWRRSHHRLVLDVGALATHLTSLYTDGRWPRRGAARIVVAGATQQHLTLLKAALAEKGTMPPAERARLRQSLVLWRCGAVALWRSGAVTAPLAHVGAVAL